MQQHQHQE
uniref:Uncharacterized protein n=1 Tax=Arundo donax TaxID=35708 RepID=A0A0A9BVN0_ARUDO